MGSRPGSRQRSLSCDVSTYPAAGGWPSLMQEGKGGTWPAPGGSNTRLLGPLLMKDRTELPVLRTARKPRVPLLYQSHHVQKIRHQNGHVKWTFDTVHCHRAQVSGRLPWPRRRLHGVEGDGTGSLRLLSWADLGHR